MNSEGLSSLPAKPLGMSYFQLIYCPLYLSWKRFLQFWHPYYSSLARYNCHNFYEGSCGIQKLYFGLVSIVCYIVKWWIKQENWGKPVLILAIISWYNFAHDWLYWTGCILWLLQSTPFELIIKSEQR